MHKLSPAIAAKSPTKTPPLPPHSNYATSASHPHHSLGPAAPLPSSTRSPRKSRYPKIFYIARLLPQLAPKQRYVAAFIKKKDSFYNFHATAPKKKSELNSSNSLLMHV
jgi:hypothetical protein